MRFAAPSLVGPDSSTKEIALLARGTLMADRDLIYANLVNRLTD